MVIDGRTLADASLVPYADARALLLGLYPDADVPPMDDVDPTAAPLVARVNHGVWIASCPCDTPGTPAPGMLVFLDAPVAWCIRCRNAATGERWRPVLLPPDDERALIEAVLAVRPDAATRNWAPGETVADLVDENRAHDLDAGV